MRLTAEGANKRDSFQHCLYHSEDQQQEEQDTNGSRYARAAERLLRDFAFLPPCPALLATESKFLGGSFGAFDFSVPLQTPWGLRWVHVEVDGETHFTKPRQGSTVGLQLERDSKKDAEALRQQCMLVRLHFADYKEQSLEQPWWEGALQRAFGLAQQQRTRCFIVYTKGYEQLGLVDKVNQD